MTTIIQLQVNWSHVHALIHLEGKEVAFSYNSNCIHDSLKVILMYVHVHVLKGKGTVVGKMKNNYIIGKLYCIQSRVSQNNMFLY